MLKALPEAKAMIADRGYDSDWFRAGAICIAAAVAFYLNQ